MVHYSDFTCVAPVASGSVGYNETDCIQAQANGLIYKIVLYTDATTGKLAAGFAWVIDPKGQALASSEALDHLGTFVTTLLGANAPPVITWLGANLGHELARQKLSSDLTAFTGSAVNESQLYVSLDSAAFLAAPSASLAPASAPIHVGFASTAADILAHYPDFACAAPVASDSVGYNQTECTQKQANGFLYGFFLFTDQTTGQLAAGGATVYGSSGKDLAPDDAATHLDAFVTTLLGVNASPVVTWLGVNLGHAQESLAISSDLIVVTDIGSGNDKSQLLVGIYSAAFLAAPTATPAPTAAPIGFASSAADILAHYSGFTCDAPVPSTRLGYNETACSQSQANGLVYWIVLSTDDTTGELAAGGAWVYGPSGKELAPSDALDHLDAFVTALLGANSPPVVTWLSESLGDGQPLAISSLLTVNTGTGANNDRSQLFVNIYSTAFQAAPQRSFGFVSTADVILAHYSGFTCDAPVAGTSVGYNETVCSQKQPNGLRYKIDLATDETTGEGYVLSAEAEPARRTG